MLKTGTKAPDFDLPDQNGERHTLEEYRGRKLVLYFYPRDNTAGCSKQAAGYSRLLEEFRKAGAEVAGVSKDSVASHKRFEEKKDLTITILSDPEIKTIEDYDVWKEKKRSGKTSMGVVRTTYLIDEEGTVIMADDKVKAASDPERMLEAVKK